MIGTTPKKQRKAISTTATIKNNILIRMNLTASTRITSMRERSLLSSKHLADSTPWLRSFLTAHPAGNLAEKEKETGKESPKERVNQAVAEKANPGKGVEKAARVSEKGLDHRKPRPDLPPALAFAAESPATGPVNVRSHRGRDHLLVIPRASTTF